MCLLGLADWCALLLQALAAAETTAALLAKEVDEVKKVCACTDLFLHHTRSEPHNLWVLCNQAVQAECVDVLLRPTISTVISNHMFA